MTVYHEPPGEDRPERPGGTAAHMAGMTKLSREDLDMNAVVDAALRGMLTAKGVNFDELPDLEKLGARQNIASVFWHGVPEILAQIQRLTQAADPLDTFVIPDTLEGLIPDE